MDLIIKDLVEAGYYRARISTLSDFDKIIGGMAWAMQVFSCDLNIDILYTDTLDLGQKISLTERLVMVMIVMKCPHQIEPHQIVGLDYTNLIPVIKWLLKKSAEVRQQHEAFNRLLALRHFMRVTKSGNGKMGSHLVPVSHLVELGVKSVGDNPQPSRANVDSMEKTRLFMRNLDEKFKDNKQMSFVDMTSLFENSQKVQLKGLGDDLDNLSEDSGEFDETKAQNKTGLEGTLMDFDANEKTTSDTDNPEELVAIHRELDTELLATNQKILNLLKKLDSMPSETEISQYQKRFIELHQQLISKNRDVKKIYALFNSLESTKHYLTKEINLLDSIASNFDLTENSASNRDQFLRQFQEIVAKILEVKEDVCSKLGVIKRKCDALNAEYGALIAD